MLMLKLLFLTKRTFLKYAYNLLLFYFNINYKFQNLKFEKKKLKLLKLLMFKLIIRQLEKINLFLLSFMLHGVVIVR